MSLLQNITTFVTVTCRKNEDIEKKLLGFRLVTHTEQKLHKQSLRVILHNQLFDKKSSSTGNLIGNLEKHY